MAAKPKPKSQSVIKQAPKQNIIQSLGSFLGNIFKPQGVNPISAIQNVVKALPRTPDPIDALNFGLTGATPKQIQSIPALQKKLVPLSSIPGGRPQPTPQPTPTQPPSGGQQINYNTPPPTGTTPISGEVTGNPVDDTLQKATDYFGSIVDLLNSGGFNANSPFALDDLLANNAAIAAISPTYAQDYARFKKAQDLDKQLGQGRAQRGLQELQQGGENYQTKLSRLLQLGQQGTGEQFAGQGLYESGARQRAQGLQNVTAQQDLQNFLAGNQRNIAGIKQQEEDLLNRLALQRQEKEMELARGQQYDVDTSVQEAQRIASSRQGIEALNRMPLTNENLPEYFKKRGETFRSFLPSYG